MNGSPQRRGQEIPSTELVENVASDGIRHEPKGESVGRQKFGQTVVNLATEDVEDQRPKPLEQCPQQLEVFGGNAVDGN